MIQRMEKGEPASSISIVVGNFVVSIKGLAGMRTIVSLEIGIGWTSERCCLRLSGRSKNRIRARGSLRGKSQ